MWYPRSEDRRLGLASIHFSILNVLMVGKKVARLGEYFFYRANGAGTIWKRLQEPFAVVLLYDATVEDSHHTEIAFTSNEPAESLAKFNNRRSSTPPTQHQPTAKPE